MRKIVMRFIGGLVILAAIILYWQAEYLVRYVRNRPRHITVQQAEAEFSQSGSLFNVHIDGYSWLTLRTNNDSQPRRATLHNVRFAGEVSLHDEGWGTIEIERCRLRKLNLACVHAESLTISDTVVSEELNLRDMVFTRPAASWLELGLQEPFPRVYVATEKEARAVRLRLPLATIGCGIDNGAFAEEP